MGAVTPVGGVYVLPAQDACVEALQWLSQEVEQADGQALIMHIEQFDGLTDRALMDLFRAARKADYAEIDQELLAIESQLSTDSSMEAVQQAKEVLAKLKRRYGEVLRIDYFTSHESAATAGRIDNLTKRLFPDQDEPQSVPNALMTDYQARQWVTRPQPHVDRLACIWLIRRFIDETATIRYAMTPKADEISFDMNDATFGHIGNLCTFETMIKVFQIEAKGIHTLAEIVHEIDLYDERFIHPETVGIDAILRGWLLEGLTDQELETRGLSLFDGIYHMLSERISG